MTAALREALTALAAKWETEVKSMDEMTDRAAARGALPERLALLTAQAQVKQGCAEALRAVLDQGAP